MERFKIKLFYDHLIQDYKKQSIKQVHHPTNLCRTQKYMDLFYIGKATKLTIKLRDNIKNLCHPFPFKNLKSGNEIDRFSKISY